LPHILDAILNNNALRAMIDARKGHIRRIASEQSDPSDFSTMMRSRERSCEANQSDTLGSDDFL
jgi:hypothetical protein